MDTPSDSSSSIAIAEAPMIRRRTIHWPAGIKQCFFLPSSIIYYIAMNPSSPKVYNKLIQTCKLFFERNPVIIAANMIEKGICAGDECFDIGKCCVKIDMNKISNKFWLTGYLSLRSNYAPNFAALFRPKVYRCDIDILFIGEKTVEFEDLKFFALSAKHIKLNKTQIVYNNGNPVMLENILEELPNVEEFECSFGDNTVMVSASTVKNISKLKNLRKLKCMQLSNIPQTFCCDDLFAFVKDRSNTKFWLFFASDISDEYKMQLDQLIDSVIESKLSNCYFSYRGQNREKYGVLLNLFFK